MFGWKRKYKILEEKYEIQKDDLNKLKSRLEYRDKQMGVLSDENKKLNKGYVTLLKLYGSKGFNSKIPYMINMVDRLSAVPHDFDERTYEINIPQIRIVLKESDVKILGLDKEVTNTID